MSKSPKTKLGFNLKDNFHSVISISENKDGELLIFPSFAENYSEIEFGNPNAEDPIVNQHYTVHNSPNSQQGINVLKHTLETRSKESKITRVFTRAFKQTNLFAPLYLARCQNISLDRYKVNRNPNDKYIELGDYDPKIATLYYIVFASNLGHTVKSDYPDINLICFDFQKYSLSFVWSFGLIPSHHTGNKSHFLTLPEIECQLKEGFTESDIIDLYRHHRQFQHLSFLEFLQREGIGKAIEFSLLKGIGFKRSPNVSIDENDKKTINLNYAYECFINARNAQNKGLTNEALKLFDVSEGIFRDEKQIIAYADVLNAKGILLQAAGFPDRAVKCYEESLETYKKHNLLFHIARAYLNLSIVHRDTSNTDIAIKMASDALDISNTQGFTSLQADANRELGVLHKNKQELDRAYEFLDIALAQYKEDENLLGEAFCLGNMGLIRAIENKFTDSLELHNQALNHFSSLKHEWGISNETANVGNMNCVLGHFELGLKQLQTALEGHQRTDYQYGIATDLKLIGGHFFNKGERTRGKQYLEKSRDLLLKIGNQMEANQISQILRQIDGM